MITAWISKQPGQWMTLLLVILNRGGLVALRRPAPLDESPCSAAPHNVHLIQPLLCAARLCAEVKMHQEREQ